jgi:hypothetical protein
MVMKPGEHPLVIREVCVARLHQSACQLYQGRRCYDKRRSRSRRVSYSLFNSFVPAEIDQYIGVKEEFGQAVTFYLSRL